MNMVDLATVDNKRKRYLTLAEVQRLGAALRELEEEGVNPKAINIARLWALTGFRRYEAAALKRAEVDFGRGGVRLIDSKEGESIRPLGAPALALLRSLKVDERSPYFFPAERGDGFYVGTKRIWPKVIKRARLAAAHIGIYSSFLWRIAQDGGRDLRPRHRSRDRGVRAPSARPQQDSGRSCFWRHLCRAERKPHC